MTVHITTAQARAYGFEPEKRSKYGNTKVLADGHKFDSKAEYLRYLQLKDELKAGSISGLSCQPRFVLQDGFRHNGKYERPITYIADFMYERGDKTIVEDCKGKRTDVYLIKRKLFLKRYGDKYGFMEVAA